MDLLIQGGRQGRKTRAGRGGRWLAWCSGCASGGACARGRRSRRRRGFTLTELLVCVAIVALLLSILLPALRGARSASRLGADLANLSQLGRSGGAYALDHRDLLWGYSWTPDRTPGAAGDLAVASTAGNLEAIQAQFAHLMRTAAGVEGFPARLNILPQLLYSHLTATDYLSGRLPEPAVACPEDRVRLAWAADPAGAAAGRTSPAPPDLSTDPQGAHARWAFSSSYEVSAAAWDKPQDIDFDKPGSPWVRRRSFNDTHFAYVVSPQGHGQRRYTDVAFPAGKVHMHDAHQRHAGQATMHFGVPGARVTVLTFDGGAALRRNSDANPGWHPRTPGAAAPHRYFYRPASWEPPTSDGSAAEPVLGYFRWTRGGLKGIDFGGAEVNTGQGG